MEMQAKPYGAYVLGTYFEKILLTGFITASLGLFFGVISSIAVSFETTNPQNVIAIAGQPVALNCCSNKSQIDWYFAQDSQLNSSEYEGKCIPVTIPPCIAITSESEVAITARNRYSVSKYTNSGSNIQCSTLSIVATNQSDGGVYGCRASFKTKINALLTIIGSEPSCYFANGSRHFHFSCKISYSGRIPKLQWKFTQTSGSITDCTEGINRVTCTIQRSTLPFYGTISCRFDHFPPHQGKDYEMVNIDIFEANSSFNTTMHCSMMSTMMFTERWVTKETVAYTNVGSTKMIADNPSKLPVATIVLAILLAIALLIIAVLLKYGRPNLLQCQMTGVSKPVKTDAFTEYDIPAEPGNTEQHDESERVRETDHTASNAEYSSLQPVKQSSPHEVAEYTELRNISPPDDNWTAVGQR